MAFFTFVLFMVACLVAISSAAPKGAIITIPEECQGAGFCSIKPEGYDEIEEKINSLLPPFKIDVDKRYGGQSFESDLETDEDNCPSVVQRLSVYSYRYPETNKIDIFVQTKMLPQVIVTVNCKNSERTREYIESGKSECFRHMGLDGFNVNFRCQTSKAMRFLMVYDPESHKIMTKNYTIPVCCSCKRIDELI